MKKRSWLTATIGSFITLVAYADCGLNFVTPKYQYYGINDQGNPAVPIELMPSDSGFPISVYAEWSMSEFKLDNSLGPGWSLPLLDACIIKIADSLWRFYRPDGYFQDYKETEIHNGIKTIESTNGWKGKIDGTMIRIYAPCGDAYEFTHGRLTKLSGKLPLEWNRNKERVIVSANKSPFVEFKYNQSGALIEVRDLRRNRTVLMSKDVDLNKISLNWLSSAGSVVRKEALEIKSGQTEISCLYENGPFKVMHVDKKLKQVKSIDNYNYVITPIMDSNSDVKIEKKLNGITLESYAYNRKKCTLETYDGHIYALSTLGKGLSGRFVLKYDDWLIYDKTQIRNEFGKVIGWRYHFGTVIKGSGKSNEVNHKAFNDDLDTSIGKLKEGLTGNPNLAIHALKHIAELLRLDVLPKSTAKEKWNLVESGLNTWTKTLSTEEANIVALILEQESDSLKKHLQ